MNNQTQLVLKSSTAEMPLNDHELGIYLTPEIDGLVGLPEIRTTSGVNSGYDGGWTSAQNYDARSITIRGVIANTDVATVERLRKQLVSLAGQGKSEELTLDLVTEAGNAYTLQVRTIALEMAMQSVLSKQEFMLQLRADDPLIYDAGESAHEATLQVAKATGGFTIDFELPLAITGGSEESVVNNDGLEEVPTIVKMYGALHNPKIINQTNNEQMQIMTDLGYAEGAWHTPSEASEGTTISLANTPDSAPFSDIQLKGDTYQNGTPTPSAPVAVQTVTGENVVKICKKNLYDEQLRAGDISQPYANPTIRLCSTQNLYLYPGTYTFSTNMASPMRYALGVNSVSAPPTGSYPTYIYDSGWTVGTGSNTTIFTINQGGYFSVQLSKVNNAELTTSEAQAYHYQLEFGSTATAYEPYQGQSYEVNLGKNLINFSSFQQSWDGASVDGEGTTITMSPNTSGSMGLLYDSTTYSVSIPAGQMIAWSRTWAGGGTWESGTITFPLKLTYADGTTETLSFGDTTENNYSQVISATKTLTKSVVSVKIESGGCFGITNLTAPTSFNLQLEYGAATTYAPYFEPIELCKIGTYQDYLYKSGGKWYVRKETQKIVLNNSENWSTWNNKNGYIGFYWTNTTLAKIGVESEINGALYCNMLSEAPTRYEIYTGSVEAIKQCGGAGNQYIAIGLALSRLSDTSTSAAAVQSFKTWLANNMPIVYATLATPTDTEITNDALIAQLDDLLNLSRTYQGQTNLSTTYASGNMPSILNVSYYTEKDPDTRDELIIDSRLHTVTLNGLDIYHLIGEGSEFLMLEPGENRLSLQSDITGDNGYAVVSYKQGYLSI